MKIFGLGMPELAIVLVVVVFAILVIVFIRRQKGNLMKKGNTALVWIGAGIGIFIVCSIIQGLGGSSMFSDRYYQPDNAFLDALISVSFWPGWMLTIGCIGRGLLLLWQTRSDLAKTSPTRTGTTPPAQMPPASTPPNQASPQMPPIAPQPLPTASQPPSQVRFCSQCGTKLDTQVNFCPSCGAPVQNR